MKKAKTFINYEKEIVYCKNITQNSNITDIICEENKENGRQVIFSKEIMEMISYKLIGKYNFSILNIRSDISAFEYDNVQKIMNNIWFKRDVEKENLDNLQDMINYYVNKAKNDRFYYSILLKLLKVIDDEFSLFISNIDFADENNNMICSICANGIFYYEYDCIQKTIIDIIHICLL